MEPRNDKHEEEEDLDDLIRRIAMLNMPKKIALRQKFAMIPAPVSDPPPILINEGKKMRKTSKYSEEYKEEAVSLAERYNNNLRPLMK